MGLQEPSFMCKLKGMISVGFHRNEKVRIQSILRVLPSSLVAVAIALPVIITILYNIHLVDLFFIPAGDLLNYFGVCLGLLGSMCVLVNTIKESEERKKSEKEREKKRRMPRVSLRISKLAEPLLKVEIINTGSKTVSDVFLFDEFITGYIFPHQSVSVQISFERDCSTAEVFSFKEFIKESRYDQGFPEEIWLTLFDEENYQWHCNGKRIEQRISDSHWYACEIKEESISKDN